MIFNIFNKILVIIVISYFLSSCFNPSENVELASFDGGVVLRDEYIDHYLLSTLHKPDILPTEEKLKEIVLKKAIEKMASQEAVSTNIDKDSLYLHVISNNERRLLYQKYVQLKITNLLINDSLVQKYYSEFSPQYRLKYIMRPFLKTSSEKFIRSQGNEIEKAYELLNSGREFKEVVEQYSQDISSNKKGGDIGWNVRESLGDEALRLVMDTLKQFDYSAPFKGYGGFYIMYKGEKREVNVPPYENAKHKIWKSLYHSRKAFIEAAVEKRFEKLSKKYNYISYDDDIKNILIKINSGSKVNNSTSLNFDKLSEKDKSIKIAKYDVGFVTVGDLFADRKRAPTNKFEFDNRLQSIANQHLFAMHAKELNIQNNDELSIQLEKMKNSLLRTILYQRLVKDKVNESMSSNEDLKSENKVKRRTKVEKEFRSEYEIKLKTKYNFKFENDSFPQALDFASIKKQEQNEAKSKIN